MKHLIKGCRTMAIKTDKHTFEQYAGKHLNDFITGHNTENPGKGSQYQHGTKHIDYYENKGEITTYYLKAHIEYIDVGLGQRINTIVLD